MGNLNTSDFHKLQLLRMHGALYKIYPPSLVPNAKKQLASEYSEGRTQRTSELLSTEIERLICDLSVIVDKQRNASKTKEVLTSAQRKFFALRKSLGWSYERLSEFIMEQTRNEKTHSRQLDDQELNTMISIMEKIEVAKYKSRNK